MHVTPHGQFDIEDFFSVERHNAIIRLLITLAKFKLLKEVTFPSTWVDTHSYEYPHEA